MIENLITWAKWKASLKEDLVMGNEVFMNRKADGYQVRELSNNACGFLSCLSKPT